MLLRCEHLMVRYGPIEAVRDATFRVEEGQIVALIGANGAGKSSILRALSGVLRKAGGRVIFRDRDITRARPHRIVQLGLVHVPEGRAILTTMSVQENLELGGYVRRDGTALRADIARGLLARPTLLVLDEPSLGLAPHLVREVMLLVRRIREEGTTVLLVEQNARQALAPADHAYVLEQGRVSLDGTGRALLSNPAVVRAYLGVAPV